MVYNWRLTYVLSPPPPILGSRKPHGLGPPSQFCVRAPPYPRHGPVYSITLLRTVCMRRDRSAASGSSYVLGSPVCVASAPTSGSASRHVPCPHTDKCDTCAHAVGRPIGNVQNGPMRPRGQSHLQIAATTNYQHVLKELDVNV